MRRIDKFLTENSQGSPRTTGLTAGTTSEDMDLLRREARSIGELVRKQKIIADTLGRLAVFAGTGEPFRTVTDHFWGGCSRQLSEIEQEVANLNALMIPENTLAVVRSILRELDVFSGYATEIEHHGVPQEKQFQEFEKRQDIRLDARHDRLQPPHVVDGRFADNATVTLKDISETTGVSERTLRKHQPWNTPPQQPHLPAPCQKARGRLPTRWVWRGVREWYTAFYEGLSRST